MYFRPLSGRKPLYSTGFLASWRESVGIEPTSPLAKTSAVLKTERDTSPVLSHVRRKRLYRFRFAARVQLTAGRRTYRTANIGFPQRPLFVRVTCAIEAVFE